ncbi:MAG: hypothetical protein D6785_04300 [Planctomycetota bacterium]|nr:MAG: hypothetical protein D6785_04300 [Planctomycetota bacterium]
MENKDININLLLMIGIPILCALLLVYILFFSSTPPAPKPVPPIHDTKGWNIEDGEGSTSKEDSSVLANDPLKNFHGKETPKTQKKNSKIIKTSSDPKEGGPDKALDFAPRGKVLLALKPGSGKEALGWNPFTKEGPRSFVVTRKGLIYILDQENLRIQIYDLKGKYVGTIPLSSNTYDLLAVDPQTSRLATLNLAERRLEILSPQGGLVTEYSLPRELVPLTHIWLEGDQLYMERGRGQFYSFSPNQQNPIPLPGRPTRKGAINVVQIAENKARITYYKKGDKDYQKAWEKELPLVASDITHIQEDESGRIYLAVRHTVEENGKIQLDEFQVIQLDSQGNILGDVYLNSPKKDGQAIIFIPKNGSVYQLINGEDKIYLSSFSIQPK